MGGQTVATFSGESTRLVLRAACDRAGLTSDGAQLLRLGENAIYRLDRQPVVVRIARDIDHWDDATKEVVVAQWLADRGMPAARTWPVAQPLDVDGHPVTFWRYIDGRRGGPGEAAALGRLLRKFHGMGAPPHFTLPPESPLRKVDARIERANLPDADRSFLVGLLDELRAGIAELTYPQPKSSMHGDAHVQNLMVADTQVVIIDFEQVCWGHREWDLSMTATEFVTAGFWTSEQYRAFVDGYGYDVTDWDGFDLLRRAREITMTTWLMQNVDQHAAIRDEFDTRMHTIRTGRPTVPWRAF